MYFSTQIKTMQSRRVFLTFTALIKINNSRETSLSEETEILTVSRHGASFALKRKCNIGQLIYLKMPMPPHLRAYDEEKELYGVWGVVQHCHKITGEISDEYHTGVAFTGRFPPASYFDNPLLSYKICGMNDDKLWKITPANVQFISRKHLRFWVYVDLELEILDIYGNVLEQEKAVTENISIRGAVIFSNLDAVVGDCVKVVCKEYNFLTIAVVRDRKPFTNELAKLHLEFVEIGFPIEKLESPKTNNRKVTFFE